MTSWLQRSREERALLNPGFCAHLFWHAVRGYATAEHSPMPFELAFLVLPLALDRKIRESLPRNMRTSLAVWLENHSLARGRIVNRAPLLVTFAKEGLLFGGVHGFISIREGLLYVSDTWGPSVRRALLEGSQEVRECAKKAEYVGKWFAHSGTAPTVLALMGVRL